MGFRQKKATGLALLAAALYALNAPFSKLLLGSVPPAMMAALLYLGAGGGMAAVGLLRRGPRQPLEGGRRYVLGMIVLDILAPISLMAGLSMSSAAHAALLNNFEIVATAVIALSLFGERISRKLWRGIALVTISCLILSFENLSSLTFSRGSPLILLACLCWGLENNCTRMLSSGDPLRIVVVKGFGAGAGSLLIALAAGERLEDLRAVPAALLLGFFAYGLSILCYVRAQRDLGAARTGAYYAVAPFVGALLSLAVFREPPGAAFWIALPVMALGTWFAAADGQEADGGEEALPAGTGRAGR